MKETLKELRKEMIKDFGKPCKIKDPFCASCIMYKALETLEEGQSFTEDFML